MPVDRLLAEDLATRITSVYADAERRIAVEVARRLAAGMDAPDWATERLRAAGALRRWAETTMRHLDGRNADRVAEVLTEAYRRGGRAALGALQQYGAMSRPAATRELIETSLPGARDLNRLIYSLTTRLGGTHLPVVRWADDAYRQVIAAGSAPGAILGVDTRRQAAQSAWDQFLSRGITGFTDAAGRRWQLSSYVEMATRTTVAQAAVEGHLDTLAETGIDLVIVSNAPMECSRCRPWEGKILRRSGGSGPLTVTVEHATQDRNVRVKTAGTVADATARGLLHPQCRHSLSAYLPGITTVPTNTEDPQGEAAVTKLRGLERDTRREKLKAEAALTPQAHAAATARVKVLNDRIAAHVAANEHLGLRRKPDRERINLGHGRTPGQLASAQSAKTTRTRVAAEQRKAAATARRQAAAAQRQAAKTTKASVPPAGPKAPAAKAAKVAPASPNPSVLTGTVMPGVTPGRDWFDLLKADTTAPIPIRNLEITPASLSTNSPAYVIRSGQAHRVNGVTYLIEDTASSNHGRILREFQAFHATLPPGTAQYQKGYAWLSGRNPADAYWERQYNITPFESFATAGNGGTHVWNRHTDFNGPSAYAESLRHEFGHNVSTAMRTRGLNDSGADWARAAASDAVHNRPQANTSTTAKKLRIDVKVGANYPLGVSNYGTSSVAEDYAESVAFYLTGKLGAGYLPDGKGGYGPKLVPLYFRDFYPERAAVLDQIFPDFAREQLREIARR